MRSSHYVRFFICIVLYLSMARAFSVTVGTPTQCDGLTVSWTGGQAPFTILLTPSMEMFQNISVPASAFTNGKGSYTIPSLTLAVGTHFLLTMSDATGFGSGGTTNELTVENAIAKNNCDIAGGPPPYTFNISQQQLVQCSPFSLTYAGAILPVTIVQLIPGGKSVVFSSVNSETFTSVADVSAGTNLMFFVTDSVGRPGGISGFQQVLSASDASCLSANSPSSTSGMAATASPSSTSSASGLSSNDISLIAGAVAGGVVVLALVVLVMCCLRRRRRRSTQPSPHAHNHATRSKASGKTKPAKSHSATKKGRRV
ncbi:hypothetical protein BDR05DRAFT_562568 [Suillus weaverae]|nr:hypothetical protein BDR05DRAFT_562568 [Suillus weaverae]